MKLSLSALLPAPRKGAAAPNEDDVRTAIEKARAERAAALASAEDLEGRKRQALLDGAPDEILDEIDHELGRAVRTLERYDAVLPALEEKLVEAEKVGRVTALKRRHAEAAKARAAAVKAQAELYPRLAREIAALLEQIRTADREIDAVNLAIGEAIVAGAISEPLESLRPVHHDLSWRSPHIGVTDAPLYAVVALPSEFGQHLEGGVLAPLHWPR